MFVVVHGATGIEGKNGRRLCSRTFSVRENRYRLTTNYRGTRANGTRKNTNRESCDHESCSCEAPNALVSHLLPPLHRRLADAAFPPTKDIAEWRGI